MEKTIKKYINYKIGLSVVGVAVITMLFFGIMITKEENGGSMFAEEDAPLGFQEKRFSDFGTDFSMASVPAKELLSGGPGKDGIPAIRNPKFIDLQDVQMNDDVQGILVEHDGIKKYYPYTILVWHEIVNDSIGNWQYMVTFCPLCGSAIVFDRNIQGTVLEFGVSGLLYESNLVMYDNKTESLWSQAKGEAIVGEYLGTKLDVFPSQFLSFKEIKEKYPDVLVLSKDTGYVRNYEFNPYVGYEESQELYFPVSINDKRFPAKTLMYVVNFNNQSVAFPLEVLEEKATTKINGQPLRAERSGDEIRVLSGNKRIPGYIEMWFSWATHHQDDGIVWDM